MQEEAIALSEADDARDHGASAWIDIYPTSNVIFEIGFSRSISYDYNSLFFSLHFDFGRILSKRLR
jgi:hypothetical protein